MATSLTRFSAARKARVAKGRSSAERAKVRCEEAQELITGLIDNELSAQESALITAHFGKCEECPKSYSHQHALKRLLKNVAVSVRAPSELRDKILRERGPNRRRAWLRNLWEILPPVRSMAVQAGVLAMLLALPFLTARYWLTSPHFPIVPGFFESYRHITAGKIVPVKMQNLAELKEKLTRLADGQFAPMAYDFSSINVHLVGGLLQKIANRNVLVAVYQGGSMTIICYTFIGSEGDAPEVAEAFFDATRGMNFYQFSYARTNAVMYSDKNINCILMSPMPMPDLLDLARTKAYSG
jgi:anti-sigma factor (TIGR02949 family)